MTEPVGIENLWARIPKLNCIGKCTDICGPILCSENERIRLRQLGINLVPARDYAAAAQLIGEGKDCPALVDGRCSVHADRPLSCRAWGAVEHMVCPHGCKPEGEYMTTGELAILLQAADFLPAEEE